MKKGLKSKWIPVGLIWMMGIISCLMYSFTQEKLNPLYYIQALGVPFVLLGIMLVEKYKVIQLPFILYYAIAVHLMLAVDFGTVLGFYDKYYFWDLLAHGYFGFLFSFLVLMLLFNFKKEAFSKIFGLVLIFFVVLGAAAIWEIFEFVMDGILHGDAQRVQESIALGKTPVYDTMMDIIITAVGVGMFYFSILFDHILGNRLYNYLERECIL